MQQQLALPFRVQCNITHYPPSSPLFANLIQALPLVTSTIGTTVSPFVLEGMFN